MNLQEISAAINKDIKNKLARRFCSVFGNYKAQTVKSLYEKTYESISLRKNTDISIIKNKAFKVFNNLATSSLLKVTNNKVNLVIAHKEEGTFSPGDLSKFIDILEVEGIKVRLVFLDYIDTMKPTVYNYSSYKDYDALGVITQELRNISRRFSVPIITATQLTKQAEDLNIPLTNGLMGDSHKKTKYSDFIYMFRQVPTKNIFDAEIAQSVLDKNVFLKDGQTLVPQVQQLYDQIKTDLMPIETKITKAKDSGKGFKEYMILCLKNLRYYDNLSQYLNDIEPLVKQSDAIQRDINTIVQSSLSANIADDFLISI